MTSALTGNEKAELIRLFDQIDEDKDGLINFNELFDLMKESGNECNEAELQDLVNEAEINEKGQISGEEFLSLVSRKNRQTDSEGELQEAFRIFDKDGSGLISAKKLYDIFTKIDSNLQEEEVLQMVKEYDEDNDGYLNYEEFSRMIKNK